jgi:hypothetical protein
VEKDLGIDVDVVESTVVTFSFRDLREEKHIIRHSSREYTQEPYFKNDIRIKI